jgi:menaquinone-dependent protoporphyrinogen oxidase
MSRHRILIVYGTRHGQTATIAARLEQVLVAQRLAVAVFNVDELPRDFMIDRFDGVLIGASVIAGKHQRAVRRFVIRNIETLNRLPSAFYSVSGSAASPDLHRQADARRVMEGFLTETGWRPDVETTLAGALAYTRYSPLMRWLLKQIARREGAPTDTSRDHEFTDWNHVEEFAKRFGHVVAPVTFEAPDALAGA